MIMTVWHSGMVPLEGISISIFKYETRNPGSRVKFYLIMMICIQLKKTTYLLHVTRRRYVGQKVIITVSFGPSVGRRYSR